MTDTKKTNKALDILVILNTAIKNSRLYPPTSASVSSTIEKLHLSLLDPLIQEEQISFSESEKALLIDGQPLSPKDQERPHTVSLLNILLGFGLKSITFSKGLEKEELARFIGLLSQKPESIHEDGGINKLLTDQTIVHISLDQKLYVAMDKDHQILSSLDITDDQITKFFTMTHPDMDPNSPQFREMAKDPEALSRVFEAGLSKMMVQKETLTSIQLSENLNSMLSLLDNVSGSLNDENRGILSQHVGQALLATDPAMAEQLTTQNVENLLGGFLLQYLMAELTHNELEVTGTGGDKEASGGNPESSDSISKLLQVADKFSTRLKDTRTLLDEGLMAVLPKIIEQLIAQKQQDAMENMLQPLVANLASESTDVRLSAAKSLADIIENLPDEQKSEVVEKLSDQIITWLTSETTFSAGYQRICVILKDITQDHLGQRSFPDALKYLDAFNSVADDTGKPNAIKNVSVEIIDQLACPEIIGILLKEIGSPDQQNPEHTGRVFRALGNTAIEDLLDQLRTTTDSDERVQIMHLISMAREKALPLITGRINKEEPWFYLRNIAYLLGQIGNEESAPALVPLLYRRNDKLRHEALKSLYRTGGSQRGKILLAAFPLADEEFKPGIVEALGQSKAVEAVPFLTNLLKNKPLITSAARTALEEKICSALGAIGSTDAIDLLSGIASAKSFLGLRSYPDKVKAAAAKALTTIQRKAGQP